MKNGWIKIHRKILDWEWWDDYATRNVFLYLLIMANHEDGYWKKIPVKRGQIIIGRDSLARKNGLEVQPTRRSLNNLQTSQQITIKTTNKYSLVTLLNYDSYQQTNQQVTRKPTNKQPANQPQTRSKEDKKKEIHKENLFSKWYSNYPKKVSRGTAEKAWKKLNPQEQLDAITGLNRLLPTLIATEKQYIPMPSTWINGKRWMDETETKLDWAKIGDDVAIAKWLQDNPAHMKQAEKEKPHAHHLSQFI